MLLIKSKKWNWEMEIAWSLSNSSLKDNEINILLIHGFGASKEHWRFNQNFLGNYGKCFSIDLLGFGKQSA